VDAKDIMSIKSEFRNVLYLQIRHFIVGYECERSGVQFNAFKSSYKADLLLDSLSEVADYGVACRSNVLKQCRLNFEIFTKSCHFFIITKVKIKISSFQALRLKQIKSLLTVTRGTIATGKCARLHLTFSSRRLDKSMSGHLWMYCW